MEIFIKKKVGSGNIKKEICPKCGSNKTGIICHHNNRRKKIPIYVYQCDNCRKRFTVEGKKENYNHKGNLYSRKPELYEKRMHEVTPDMKEDETVKEYFERKYK